MAGEAKRTQDHAVIRRWVEERGGYPATVVSTSRGQEAGLLRIDYPGYGGQNKLKRISWARFFDKFDQENLVFLYQDQTATGRPSRFSKFVAGARGARSSAARSRAATGKRVESKTRSRGGTGARPKAKTPSRASRARSGSTTRKSSAQVRKTSGRSSRARFVNAELEEAALENRPRLRKAEETYGADGLVVGVFRNRAQVNCAEAALKEAGLSENQIGLAMRGQGPTELQDQGTRAEEGAAGGLVAGGVVGGIIGAAVAMVLPGVGPVLAGGILASTLAGAATGAIAGGILGTLVGLGIPEEEARYYDEEFKAGRIIMTAQAGGRRDQVVSILRDCGAYDMQSRQKAIGSARDERIRLDTEEHNVRDESEERGVMVDRHHKDSRRGREAGRRG